MEESPEGSWASIGAFVVNSKINQRPSRSKDKKSPYEIYFRNFNLDIKVSHQDLYEVIRDADDIFEDELVIMKNTDMDKEHKEQYSADKLLEDLVKVPSLIFLEDMKEINWNKKGFMNRQWHW